MDSEILRGHARAYLKKKKQREDRAAAILGGESPHYRELMSGLPPLGGSLARDIRHTATVWLAGEWANPPLRKLLEAMHEAPSLATVRAVWRKLDEHGVEAYVYDPDVTRLTYRLVWYAALFGVSEAMDWLKVKIQPSDDDFWTRIYLDGFFQGAMVVDMEENHEGFQENILQYGLAIQPYRIREIQAWLPFADKSESAEKAAAEPGKATSDDPPSVVGKLKKVGEEKKPKGPGHVVLGKLHPLKTHDRQKTAEAFKEISEDPVPLRLMGKQSIDAFLADWPHAREVVLRILRHVHYGQPVRLEPVVLVGAPGTGKTTLLQALAAFLKLPSIVYSATSTSDNTFGGTPSRWASAGPSVPLELIRRTKCANALVIVDEIEKAGVHPAGSLVDALLPFLETHTSSAYFETVIEANADLSRMNFLATANDLGRMSAPLKDRFVVIQMPDPKPEHVGALARRIVADLAKARGQEGLLPPLAPDELDVVARVWGGGSIRKLTRAVETAVDHRDGAETRQ